MQEKDLDEREHDTDKATTLDDIIRAIIDLNNGHASMGTDNVIVRVTIDKAVKTNRTESRNDIATRITMAVSGKTSRWPEQARGRTSSAACADNPRSRLPNYMMDGITRFQSP